MSVKNPVLVSNQDGKEIKIGDEVVTFRGERATLVDIFPQEGKSGRVRIRFQSKEVEGYYFPSVIGAHFE